MYLCKKQSIVFFGQFLLDLRPLIGFYYIHIYTYSGKYCARNSSYNNKWIMIKPSQMEDLIL